MSASRQCSSLRRGPVPLRCPAPQGAQRQADSLRGIRLRDDAHKDVLPGKSCNGEGIPLGIEKFHAAPAQGRMGLFQAAKGAVQPIVGAPLEILLPGHGVAAALVGIRGAVNFRLVPIVDGGCTGEQELEAGRALKSAWEIWGLCAAAGYRGCRRG